MKLHLVEVLYKDWFMMVSHNWVFRNISAFIIIFFVFWNHSLAQDNDLEKEETSARIEKAANEMYAGNYEESYQQFKSILDNAKSLPPEICYYFGVNSFQLKKYKQSINWLNKYLELKGTNGEHSESCEAYLNLAEEEYRTEHTNNSENKTDDTLAVVEEMVPSNYDIHNIIDCNKYGKIICPVCKGKGVIIKEGLFGKEYRTCPYGDDYGYMSCEDYNLLMQGKLEPKKRQ